MIPKIGLTAIATTTISMSQCQIEIDSMIATVVFVGAAREAAPRAHMFEQIATSPLRVQFRPCSGS
jgi:hypothetical protein